MLTHCKISEMLGLSQATVTNILNQKPGLRYSEETRKRVLELAAKLGYQPNRNWQAVRRGRSNLIGIITVEMQQEVVRYTTSQLPLLINTAGYDYMVVDLQWHGGNVERVIQELIRARVEGVLVVFMSDSFRKEYVDTLHNAGIPMVAVHGNDQFGIPVIWSDIRSASTALTRHLYDLGHRTVVMVAGTSVESRPVRERIEGFQAATREHGEFFQISEADFPAFWSTLPRQRNRSRHGIVVTLDFKKYGYNSTDALYAFSSQLFCLKRLPDALMCNNDAGAFGVFAAAQEHGIRIPRQMALTGFDNDAFGALPAFSLTTVHHNMDAACSKAVETLLDRISGKETLHNFTLPAELVIRRSCGAGVKRSVTAIP